MLTGSYSEISKYGHIRIIWRFDVVLNLKNKSSRFRRIYLEVIIEYTKKKNKRYESLTKFKISKNTWKRFLIIKQTLSYESARISILLRRIERTNLYSCRSLSRKSISFMNFIRHIRTIAICNSWISYNLFSLDKRQEMEVRSKS